MKLVLTKWGAYFIKFVLLFLSLPLWVFDEQVPGSILSRINWFNAVFGFWSGYSSYAIEFNYSPLILSIQLPYLKTRLSDLSKLILFKRIYYRILKKESSIIYSFDLTPTEKLRNKIYGPFFFISIQISHCNT